MTPIRAFLIVCMLAFVMWCIYEMVRLWRMKMPKPGNACDTTGQVWDDSCNFFKETKYDPTIVSPKGKRLYLLKFTEQGNTALPIYNPVWYRFRYVNTLTGGYSDFSDWTQSAVMSGSCCLPCVAGIGMCAPSSTSSPSINGFGSCKTNMPTIGIEMDQLDYIPFAPIDAQGTSIVPNVHRYVSSSGDNNPPSDDVQDDIIGALYEITSTSDTKYASFADIVIPACGSSDGSAGDASKCSKSGNVCYSGSTIVCDISQCTS